jgi:hypothetical protein
VLLWFLRAQNHKSKEYKSFIQTFFRRQSVGHHENWPARVHSIIGAVRLKTIRR